MKCRNRNMIVYYERHKIMHLSARREIARELGRKTLKRSLHQAPSAFNHTRYDSPRDLTVSAVARYRFNTFVGDS